ncbi:YceI family protein [Terriglobus roseus]|uniref:Polyisoprenoid-binding protein YceI n=1 Tax=Terriglobus roseus TaxID=392734 RepID=A0A1G7M2K1_9BACT|nr:YceI family protein [Terriglobus roseus]SDF55854.1 Polyisoprenoid-binding protein YceI [Terriglobus roseus]
MSLRRILPAALLVLSTSLAVAQAPGGGQRGPGGPGGPQQPPPPPTAGAKLDIIEGSSASYRVTEQLAGIDFPNEAVGTTTGVTGMLQLMPDGSLAPNSKLVVDLKGLTSDQGMRDGYIRNRTLETDKFPDAVFVPTSITGVPKMVPSTGQVGVALTGNLTIHGVTKPVTFKGIATLDPRSSTVAGRALTTFTFADFNLTKPTLARLMSVDDKITLELVYKFKRS